MFDESLHITTRQKNCLAKKNIVSTEHLRRWYPLRYLDYSHETGAHPNATGEAVVIGRLCDCTLDTSSATGLKYISFIVQDRLSGEDIRGFIFGQYFAFPHYRKMVDQEVIVCGKLKYDPRFSCRWSFQTVDVLSTDITNTLRIVPVYSKIKGVSEESLESLITSALAVEETDTLPESDREKLKIPSVNEAIRYVMAPQSLSEITAGRKRLVFDDLLYMAANFVLSERETVAFGPEIKKSDITLKKISELPFTLTADQRAVFSSIREKMLSGQHVNALVQGDVGCGKTIVAFLLMLQAVENGLQAMLMAPTRVLAEQHYSSLQKFLEGTGIQCALVTNKTVTAEKKAIMSSLAANEPVILVGTHSLLSDDYAMPNLGIVVVDEEHKFGVDQREKLLERKRHADYVSMSATPIPRTLAKAVWGNDTDIHIIRSMPAGRLPIITSYDNGDKVPNAVRWILSKGQQVYIVAPMISSADDDSTMAGVLSVEEITSKYKKLFPDVAIATLSGKTPAEETADILERFKGGDIQILISTTVVEVGVDVPNATLIVLYNAERFGLASMHQLRGRVGRNSLQSYCVLVSEQINERIQTMCDTSDGFTIAEKDLEMRRAGQLFGTDQSGRNQYIESIIKYPNMYQRALELARTYPSERLRRHIQHIGACENPRKTIS